MKFQTRLLSISIFLLAGRLVAQDYSKTSLPGPAKSDPQKPSHETDLFTGSFQYSIPLRVAPGRGGSEPALALGYGSSGGNGWCGVGWGLELGHIRRETRNGVPIKWNASGVAQNSYEDAKGFVFSFAGSSSQLVNVGGNVYRPKVDTTFLKFVYNGTSWTVTDTSGNQYFFGETAASRQENPKFPTGTGASTFLWAVSRSLDTNGNQTNFSYQKFNNQIYPLQISYNQSVSTPPIAATHTVDFILEDRKNAGDSANWDDFSSLNAGFKVEIKKRLKEVDVKVSGQRVRKYKLAYTKSPSTSRTLLASVQEFGTDGTTSLPPLTLSYQAKPFEFESPVTWGPMKVSPAHPGANNPTAFVLKSGGSLVDLDLRDMDRDGFPDRVMQDSKDDLDGSTLYNQAHYDVQFNDGKLNGGTGFDLGPLYLNRFSFQKPSTAVDQRSALEWIDVNGVTAVSLMDINGDGFPDRVQDPAYTGGSTDSNFTVEYGTGTGFQAPINFGPASDQGQGAGTGWNEIGWTSNGEVVVAMMDMNGDRLPDRVLRQIASPYDIRVQLNTGSGFLSTLYQWNTANHYYTTAAKNDPFYVFGDDTVVGLFDANGDGLPDRVMQKNVSSGFDNLIVQLNNGYGFESSTSEKWISWGPLSHPEGSIAEFSDPVLSKGAIYLESSYVHGSSSCMPCTQYVTYNKFSTLFEDINGDGLADKLMRRPNTGSQPHSFVFQLNNGHGFDSWKYFAGLSLPETAPDDYASPGFYVNPYSAPMAWQSMGSWPYAFVGMYDMNNDGLLDRVIANKPFAQSKDAYLDVQINKGPFPDLLYRIQDGVGGSIETAYKPSSQFDNRDKLWEGSYETPWEAGAVGTLPYPIQVVSSMTVKDGMGSPGTDQLTTFDYQGGFHDYASKEFRGFRKVTRTAPDLSKTVTYFHQGGAVDVASDGEFQDAGAFAKAGIPFRTELWGSDGKQYKRTVNKVAEFDLGNGRRFPYVAQTVEFDYEGLATGRARANRSTYLPTGTTGNLVYRLDRQENLGEIPWSGFNYTTHAISGGLGSDETVTLYQYASLANPDILDRVSEISLHKGIDGSGALTVSTKLRWTKRSYDFDGNLQSESKAYDIVGGKWLVDAYTYDAYGNMETHTAPDSGVTKTEYDSIYRQFPSKVWADFGGLHFLSQNTFDAKSGLATQSTDPKGLVIKKLYDKFFRLEQSSQLVEGGAEIWTEKFIYNLGGIAADKKSLNYTLRQTQNGIPGDIDGHRSYTYTDGLGRTVQTRTEKEGSSSQFRVADTFFDSKGNAYQTSQIYLSAGSAFTFHPVPAKPKTTSFFDPINRVVRTSPPPAETGFSPLGDSLVSYKDGTTLWVSVTTNPNGFTRKAIQNGLGRTVAIVDEEGRTTTYQYKLTGELEKVWDSATSTAATPTVSMSYDDLGRKTAMIDADMGSWSYSYHANGKVLEQTDALGQKSKMFYDKLGRVTRKEVRDAIGSLVDWIDTSYDMPAAVGYIIYKGQLARASDKAGNETRFSCDLRGRVLMRTHRIEKTGKEYDFRFEYDNAGHTRTITYPGDLAKVEVLYDSAGQIQTVRSLKGTGAQEVFYQAEGFDDQGKLEGILYGNGVRTAFDYWPISGRLLSAVTTDPSGAPLQSFAYTFDKLSNVLSINDGVTSSGAASATLTGIQYDSFQRLKSLNRQGTSGIETVSFGYNGIGNIVSSSDAGPGDYQYLSPLGQPHAVTYAKGKSYIYDANGNMRQRGSQMLHYDAQNRLVRVEDGAKVTEFGYGESGQRIWRESGGKIDLWIGGFYEEKNGRTLFHVMAGSRRVCSFEPILESRGSRTPSGGSGSTGSTATGATFSGQVAQAQGHLPKVEKIFHYFHGDHLQSTSLATNRDGKIVHHYVYKPYGEEKFSKHFSQQAPSNLFTDQVFDKDTGLYYYNARYYDPEIGRFVQADTLVPSPKDPQTLNRYSYALNNPLKYNDPSGHFSQAAITAALQGAAALTKASIQQWFALDAYYQANAKPMTTYLPVGDNKAIAWFQIQEPELYTSRMQKIDWQKLGIHYRRPTLVPETTIGSRGDVYRRGIYHNQYHREMSSTYSLLYFHDGSTTKFGTGALSAGVSVMAGGRIALNHTPVVGTVLDLADLGSGMATAVGDIYRMSQGQATRTRGSDVAGAAFDGGGVLWDTMTGLDALSTGGPELPLLFPRASVAIPLGLDAFDDFSILADAIKAMPTYTPVSSWTDMHR